MVTGNSTMRPPAPSAAYVRMSSGKQEKSPAEQRAELTKLAAREGCSIVRWFADEAITGDTSTVERSGLAALLAGAQAGEFSTVLAWHTNRLSRQDPLDCLEFYNKLRKAGATVITCCEGRIDPKDFASQILLLVGGKANNDFLKELSAKVLRGKIASAQAGGRAGGPVAYGMERGLFTEAGKLVRRLAVGEIVKLAGHVVKDVPALDPGKLAAVRYAFERFDSARLSFRALGKELDAKGFPRPESGRWNDQTVARLLGNPVYCGSARFGSTAAGKYHRAEGEDVAPVLNGNGNGRKPKRQAKPQEDWIVSEGAHPGIIAVDLFQRVQRKLPARGPMKQAPKAVYPLSGLLFCRHCGQPLTGTRRYDGHVEYVCSSYLRHGADNPTKCGKYALDAQRVQAWLANAIREHFTGPARAELVDDIRQQLKADATTSKADTGRLEKQAADLERQVDRLVQAIRTTDAPELVQALNQARAERHAVQAALRQAVAYQEVGSLDQAADAVVNELWALDEVLREGEPCEVQEAFRRAVQRIDCRWEPMAPSRRATGAYRKYQLAEGEARVWPPMQIVSSAWHV